MTNHLYPFTNGEELKKVISQADINFQIANITSSMLLAANDIKEYISEEVWDMLMIYFNTEKFELSGDDDNDPIKDQAFRLLRMAHGNFTFLHHMPFLPVSITSGGITTKKGDTETTAFRYQTDAIEQKFRQSGWSAIGELLDYLTKKSTAWTVWAAKTDYIINQHTYHIDKYYKAKAPFTSGDDFVAGNWTEVAEDDMVFLVWTKSVQFTELQALIFDGFRDFGRNYEIENDAVFYMRIRHIIADKTDELLNSRIKLNKATEYQLKLAKKVIAYYSIAEAILQFDISILPTPIRNTINNEHSKKGADDILKKEKLANLHKRTGESFLHSLDQELSRNEANTDEEKEKTFEVYEQKLDADDPSVSMV